MQTILDAEYLNDSTRSPLATAAMTTASSTVIPTSSDFHTVVVVWNVLDADGAATVDDGIDADFFNSTSLMNWTAALDRDAASTGDPMFGYPYPSLYSWSHIVAASTAVTVVMLAIIFGNGLVVVAIAVDRGLRGLQNWFVASLAVSDLLVGLFIMPLTLTNELIGYWPFGEVVCELWLSTDVLLCTASILNLCLISLDRYWSIVRPIAYVRARTPRRAAAMISIVWVLSMVICLPPLVGWKRPQPTKYERFPLCVLSEEPGYIIYSSMGSFYLPLVVMVLVYFKIYLAARDRARRNLKGKMKKKPPPTTTTTTTKKLASANSSETAVTTVTCSTVSEGAGFRKLRTDAPGRADGWKSKAALTSPSPTGIQDPDSFVDLDSDDDAIVVAVENPIDGMEAEIVARHAGNIDRLSTSSSAETRLQSVSAVEHGRSRKLVSTSKSCSSSPGIRGEGNEIRPLIEYHLIPTGTGNDCDRCSDAEDEQANTFSKSSVNRNYLNESPSPEMLTGHPDNDADSRLSLLNSSVDGVPMRPHKKTSAERSIGRLSIFLEPQQQCSFASGNSSPPQNIDTEANNQHRRHSALLSVKAKYFRSASPTVNAATSADNKTGRSVEPTVTPAPDPERTKRKMARARERRATLVLGIVMASFIGCWLPFFAIYPATALAGVGVPPSLFAVIFWLGYCNSALNPIIYTIFNREFRTAFGRILCSGRRRQQRGMMASGGGIGGRS